MAAEARHDLLEPAAAGSLDGADRAVVNGIKLALSQAGNKAGQCTVKYQSLDDSTAQAGKWDPGQTAAERPQGGPGPEGRLLHRRVQLGRQRRSRSRSSTRPGSRRSARRTPYVGLTTNEPGAEPGRAATSTTRPASAPTCGSSRATRSRPPPADAMKEDGCTKVVVANDKEAYGAGPGHAARAAEGQHGVTVVGNDGIDPKAPNFRSYASKIKGQGADCFFFGGIVANSGVQITKDVDAALRTPSSSAPTASARARSRNPTKGGVPASDRPADPVHGRDARPGRVPGRQEVPRRATRPSTARRTRTRTRSTATRR